MSLVQIIFQSRTIMRSYRFVAEFVLMFISSGLAAQIRPPSRAAMAVIPRAVHDANVRGYAAPRATSEMIPQLAPSLWMTVPNGSMASGTLLHLRSCDRTVAAAHHRCVQFDVLMIYAIDDSTGSHVKVGVIPRTFIGDSANDAEEIAPSSAVVADAGVIARRYDGAVVPAGPRPPASAPSSAAGQAGSSEAAFARAQVEAGRRGFGQEGGPARALQGIWALGPSPASTGTEFISPMAARRGCTATESAAHHPCVRIDWLEIFFGPDSTRTSSQLGVIPHTFVGAKEEDIVEVEADSDVVDAANAVAQAAGGRVVHAIPWKIPVTPTATH